MMTLNSVLAFAICRVRSGAVAVTRCAKGARNGRNSRTPNTLKSRCAQATRRASAGERRLARNAVAQVPMFAPRTI